jgi:hypothetical protein
MICGLKARGGGAMNRFLASTDLTVSYGLAWQLCLRAGCEILDTSSATTDACVKQVAKHLA